MKLHSTLFVISLFLVVTGCVINPDPIEPDYDPLDYKDDIIQFYVHPSVDIDIGNVECINIDQDTQRLIKKFLRKSMNILWDKSEHGGVFRVISDSTATPLEFRLEVSYRENDMQQVGYVMYMDVYYENHEIFGLLDTLLLHPPSSVSDGKSVVNWLQNQQNELMSKMEDFRFKTARELVERLNDYKGHGFITGMYYPDFSHSLNRAREEIKKIPREDLSQGILTLLKNVSDRLVKMEEKLDTFSQGQPRGISLREFEQYRKEQNRLIEKLLEQNRHEIVERVTSTIVQLSAGRIYFHVSDAKTGSYDVYVGQVAFPEKFHLLKTGRKPVGELNLEFLAERKGSKLIVKKCLTYPDVQPEFFRNSLGSPENRERIVLYDPGR